MIAPIYIAELSPKEKRGSLVTYNTAFVTFGILGSTLIASGFTYLPHNIGWRFMLGFAGIPSLLQMIGFIFMPESPRYLCLTGKDSEALLVMNKIYGDLNKAKEELKSIQESFEQDRYQSNGSNVDRERNGTTNIELESTKESTNTQNQVKRSYLQTLVAIFKDPSTRHCILIGICLHIGQQFCGINTIMYYGATGKPFYV